jgi:hypothetical protein
VRNTHAVEAGKTRIRPAAVPWALLLARPPLRGNRARAGPTASRFAANDRVQAEACGARRWLLLSRRSGSLNHTAALRTEQSPRWRGRIRRNPAAPGVPPGRVLSRSSCSRPDDPYGDDARVRSGSPTAGADLRFARAAGDVGTFEINGKDAPSVRMRHRHRPPTDPHERFLRKRSSESGPQLEPLACAIAQNRASRATCRYHASGLSASVPRSGSGAGHAADWLVRAL